MTENSSADGNEIHITSIDLEGIEFFSLGKHILGEFLNCQDLPDTPEELEKIMLEAARLMKATIVESVFHKFNPYGLSGVVVIAESHLAVHTWPEYNCAAIDLFSCGNLDVKAGLLYIKKKLLPENVDLIELPRGKAVLPKGSTKKSSKKL